MPSHNISSIQTLFQSGLTTVERLLNTAQTHFGSESFLEVRKWFVYQVFSSGSVKYYKVAIFQ